MTFYEIDPAIGSLARDPDLFTYIADSDASVETIVATGRLGLAAMRRLRPPGHRRVIVRTRSRSTSSPGRRVALYADRVSDDA